MLEMEAGRMFSRALTGKKRYRLRRLLPKM
jgi:hypothetical protein